MMKPLACGMALTLFLQFIQSKIDLLIISDWLCLSVLIFCTVLAIGISVESHIVTSLVYRGWTGMREWGAIGRLKQTLKHKWQCCGISR